MSLAVDCAVRRGPLDLRVALSVDRGELVAVLGPNGSGKSTLLRCIAGLLPIDHGRITVDETVLDDPATDTFVAPEHRPIGVVFQDYLLFAHLSALENVAFGLRARGMPKAAARAVAGDWLARVGLADHARHRPGELSGGQAQRVALARALAVDPALLLLDEPLAALDAGTRGEVRRDLRRHLESFDGMRVMVTHDPVDAYALADRVVVLEAGAVVQQGTLDEVDRPAPLALRRRPRRAQPRRRRPARRDVRHAERRGDRGRRRARSAFGGPALAAVRPQAVTLHRTHPEGSARNVWQLTVDDIDERHDRARVRLRGALTLVAEVTPAAVRDLALHVGDRVWASVKATDIDVYER